MSKTLLRGVVLCVLPLFLIACRSAWTGYSDRPNSSDFVEGVVTNIQLSSAGIIVRFNDGRVEFFGGIEHSSLSRVTGTGIDCTDHPKTIKEGAYNKIYFKKETGKSICLVEN